MRLSSQHVVTGSILTLLSTVYFGCSHFSSYRAPANSGYGTPATRVSSETLRVLSEDVKRQGGNIHFNPGLTNEEAFDLWHLSEGADVYPLLWFLNVKSFFSNQTPKGVALVDALEDKFGVIPTPEEMRKYSKYPLPWIGLSVAWSDEHPTQADAVLRPGQKVDDLTIVRQLEGGKKSIAMVGTNCSFCHTNVVKIQHQGKVHTKIYDGGPGMLNIRGFFQDMFASTAKTMLTEDLLFELLQKSYSGQKYEPAMREQYNRNLAKTFVNQFKDELGLNSFKNKAAEAVLPKIDKEWFEFKKKNSLRKTMFAKRAVLQKYLTRLLMYTYDIDQATPEMNARMEFLAKSIGLDPDLATTPEGYARTDAFGRIANLVARSKNPIPLTATTSVPSMWNMEKRALFHWNGNTNSVVMRNLGQSFGLGAVLTNPNGEGLSKYDATANLYNLQKLEGLLYKIQSPKWSDFPLPVDLPKAQVGCQVYYTTCAKCHEPEKNRVGPKRELVLHKMIPLNKIGTDRTYLDNQATPVEGKAFKDTLFGFTGAVRDRFYQRYNVSVAQQAEWERREMRGPEIFRDTVLGEARFKDDPVSGYMHLPAQPTYGYPARHLSGVWATAPYLHNGSVANIEEMLKPASERMKMFFVGSEYLDTERLGFYSDRASVMPNIPDLEQRAQRLLEGEQTVISWISSKIKGKREGPKDIIEAKTQVVCAMYPERCFNALQVGNSNAGHEGQIFGTNLSREDKQALIEFLKILRPEPEFSHNEPPRYSAVHDEVSGEVRCQTYY